MDPLLDDDEFRNGDPDVEELEKAQALVPIDFSQAQARLEELANRGSVMAMLYLGFALSKRGQMEQAKRWYRLAYEKGSSTALFSLATLEYHGGRLAEAQKLWEEGASRNDAPSMFWLASIYLNSSKTDRLESARKLLERADHHGQVRATHLLAKLLLTGKYGIENVPKGLLLFIKFLLSGFQVAYRDAASRRLW